MKWTETIPSRTFTPLFIRFTVQSALFRPTWKKKRRLQWSLHLTTYNLHTNTPVQKVKMPKKLGLATYITCNIHTRYGAVWLVIFARDLFLWLSWEPFTKIRTVNFWYPHAWWANCVSIRHQFKLSSHPHSNRSLSVSVHLMAIALANQKIEVLHPDVVV